ncbi:copper resistance protein CopD [Polymorphobacter multimanifer]|uniref:Putative copper resistance protein D n=1 Tax=Polymorphobacter multimanifer TaxID=1070431 RepID=A0A841L862_9SPHN|nr:copper homeostasis membrane protein CopD [Polymorphobacter multimanifer]MBB6228630.1 putative copper resistance protein D [Polymorphobacter multimanifer]GGI68882.1 copper resistance protein CopD [Polymorphobacter multimanifer]
MDAALGIMARWALVADLMLLFGVPMFVIYSDDSVGARVFAPLPIVVLFAASGGFLLSALGLAIAAATMSGVPLAQLDAATLAMLVNQTAVGTTFLVRMSVLVVAAALALSRRDGRKQLAAIALCGAVALGSLAWSGHGVMDDGRTGIVHLGADIAHLLAAGVWVGALASLLWLVATGQNDAPESHRALSGFASVGTASVAVVLITGLVNSWLLVGPSNLLSLGKSLYGQLLLIKLSLFAGMLALAALNRFHFTPALDLAVTAPASRHALQRLRLSLTLETLAGIAILGLVAWIGSLEPPVSMP